MKRPLTEDLLKTFVKKLEDEINFYYVKEVKKRQRIHWKTFTFRWKLIFFSINRVNIILIKFVYTHKSDFSKIITLSCQLSVNDAAVEIFCTGPLK